MREISIRTLKAKLSAELKDLPFAVTNNGRIIGYMVEDCSHIQEDCSHANVVTPKKGSHLEKVRVKLEKIVREKSTTSIPAVTGQG